MGLFKNNKFVNNLVGSGIVSGIIGNIIPGAGAVLGAANAALGVGGGKTFADKKAQSAPITPTLPITIDTPSGMMEKKQSSSSNSMLFIVGDIALAFMLLKK